MIIKNAFIELGGGTIQNQKEKQDIETVINQVIQKGFSFTSFISKMGSGYLVVVYVEPENDDVSIQEYRKVQHEIKARLKDQIPTILITNRNPKNRDK